MNNLFRYDNPVMSLITKVMNCIYLNLLWLLCCIPIFTIGASTSAFYYTIEKTVKDERGYIGKSFFHAFKMNFKQGTAIWLILLAVEGILLCDVWILKAFEQSGFNFGNAYAAFYVFMILVFLYTVWNFTNLARFKNSTIKIMKNSLILMIRHPLSDIAILFSLGIGTLILWLIPVTVFFIPVFTLWIVSASIEKVFSKYDQAKI